MTHEIWHCRPDYSEENVYRLWDEDDNYHTDTSPEAMDRRAALIEAAPVLYAAVMKTLINARTPDATDWGSVITRLQHALSIAQSERKVNS